MGISIYKHIFMKAKMSRIVLFLLFPILFCGFTSPHDNSGTLVLEISHITAQTGDVHVAIFNSQGTFLKDKQYILAKRFVVDNQTGSFMRVEIPNLPYGTYAMSIYHDINNNHILDQSGLGIPIEPYALSNNVKVKWRRPSFEECKFVFGEPSKTMGFELKYWKDR